MRKQDDLRLKTTQKHPDGTSTVSNSNLPFRLVAMIQASDTDDRKKNATETRHAFNAESLNRGSQWESLELPLSDTLNAYAMSKVHMPSNATANLTAYNNTLLAHSSAHAQEPRDNTMNQNVCNGHPPNQITDIPFPSTCFCYQINSQTLLVSSVLHHGTLFGLSEVRSSEIEEPPVNNAAFFKRFEDVDEDNRSTLSPAYATIIAARSIPDPTHHGENTPSSMSVKVPLPRNNRINRVEVEACLFRTSILP